MTRAESPDRSGLVAALAEVSRRKRLARKLLVAPNFAVGRELLRRLALEGDGWIGFEITTPHRMAQRLALTPLDDEGQRLLDPFEQQALLDEALDYVLVMERGVLAELGEGVGFRERVCGAILELRLAGVGPRELEGTHFVQWDKKLFLLRLLQRYERLLVERRRADKATLLSLALRVLEASGNRLPEALDAEVVLLLPGLGTRGLQGRLVSGLAARGARVLPADPVVGMEAPATLLQSRSGPPAAGSFLYAPADAGSAETGLEVHTFAAGSVDAELRQVLRRVVAAGLRWDEVEIIASDAAVYGSALHALAQRLGVPVTYAVGLPVGRTRTGRVVEAYLDWIEGGFQADVVRRLLEAGDLRPPRARGVHAPAALARRFRSLRVGWGRQRYRVQIREALAGLEDMTPGRHESPESFDRRRTRARMELEALRAVLFPALKATPTIPDRTGESGEAVSPAEVARGLQAFLRRVPGGRGPDRTARAEVARILERVSATLIRRTEFRAAVSILRGHLDIRVRPEIVGDDVDGSGAPWASMGGAVHLSDLEHGGFSGRRATFLVGMDADRVPGGGSQDPVLLDGDRRVLGDGLPTSSELLRERMYRVAALFARLRGQVTLSYGAWQATEARSVGASSVLLQAHRLARMDATPTFGDLHQALGRIVSAIPRQGTPALDRDDVWMAALGSDSVMRRGVEAVRRSFPELDAGLAALYERRTGTPGPVHGVVVPRPELMDPRRNESLVLSASRLEALGSCPLRYLHSSVLRIYPPDDPELDPDVWLGHRERGSLLHEVYDGALRASKEAGIRPDDAAFERLALVVLDRCIDRMRRELPTPGEGTLARETAALREDVRSFVRLIRDQSPNSIALELRFGLGEDEPLALALAGGTVRIRGAIDRVDEDLAGLHVVDYKTGVPRDFEKGVFHGGRRLQHAVYAMAAERRLRGEVVDGQYHFPTRRGQNQVFSFPRGQLGSVLELLDIMMEGVAAGHFVPSDDASDCSYCDFAEVCRVRRGEYGSATSSLAAWAEEHFNAGLQPAFRQLKQVRGFEG